MGSLLRRAPRCRRFYALLCWRAAVSRPGVGVRRRAAHRLAGTYLVWQRAPAGTALGCYGIAYNAVVMGSNSCAAIPEALSGRRFPGAMDRARAEPRAVAGELSGWLPMHAWHLAVTSALLAATAGTAYRWRRALLGPRHVQEIAEAVAELDRLPMRRPGVAPAPVEVSQTSLGLCISGARLRQPSGLVDLLRHLQPCWPQPERRPETRGLDCLPEACGRCRPIDRGHGGNSTTSSFIPPVL